MSLDESIPDKTSERQVLELFGECIILDAPESPSLSTSQPSARFLLDPNRYHCAGAHSDIYLCTPLDGKTSTTKVAIKILRQPNFPSRRILKMIKSLRDERWAKADRSQVAVFKDLVVLKNSCYAPWIGIAYEFYELGNIRDYTSKHPDSKFSLLKSAAYAISLMHSKEVVHGRLRASNLLVKKLADTPQIVLMDDGMHNIDTRDLASSHTAVYARWSAPELMNPKDHLVHAESGCLSTIQSDVYAFCMTLIEVVTGEEPFSEVESVFTVVRDVVEGRTPGIPADVASKKLLSSLLLRGWRSNPSDRPTILEFYTALSET